MRRVSVASYASIKVDGAIAAPSPEDLYELHAAPVGVVFVYGRPQGARKGNSPRLECHERSALTAAPKARAMSVSKRDVSHDRWTAPAAAKPPPSSSMRPR